MRHLCMFLVNFRKYTCGDYAVLFEVLSSNGCSCVYELLSGDATVNRLASVVTEALKQTVPSYTCTRESNSPSCCSSTLKYYINKKSQYSYCYKKSNAYYEVFLHFHKLVNITVKFEIAFVKVSSLQD
jgi:hypothetical protein